MDPLRAQQLAAELEVEMMADMYNRMTNACHRKCVPPHCKEAELSKGESCMITMLTYSFANKMLSPLKFNLRLNSHFGVAGDSLDYFDIGSQSGVNSCRLLPMEN
uniref:Uncharacterized protein n=1 Tax=Sphaerodactylus townsendi TaxID=933632 RepID=A0ACB8EV62_9SAUR